MTYQEFIGSESNRRRYWARAHIGWSRMSGARPNATHHWLAAHQDGLTGLITQNVDTLHELAGHRDVIDLHGRIDRVRCLDCGAVTGRVDIHQRLDALNPGWSAQDAAALPDGDVALEATDGFVLADCDSCGGRLKPDVVFFGEGVPKDRVDKARAALEESDAMLVVGSSLAVYSGYRFCEWAAALRKPIAAINIGRTRADPLLALKANEPCGPALTDLAERLGGAPRRPRGGPALSRG
jgi:NAD-dependent SIR2 family protein deacetylase